MTHLGRFSQYQTAPVQSPKMRDQFSRNRFPHSEAVPTSLSTSLVAHEADKSAAPIPHSLPSNAPQTAADSPALDPSVPGTLSQQTHAGMWHQMLNTGAA
jgi:hypothetical protein